MFCIHKKAKGKNDSHNNFVPATPPCLSSPALLLYPTAVPTAAPPQVFARGQVQRRHPHTQSRYCRLAAAQDGALIQLPTRVPRAAAPVRGGQQAGETSGKTQRSHELHDRRHNPHPALRAGRGGLCPHSLRGPRTRPGRAPRSRPRPGRRSPRHGGLGESAAVPVWGHRESPRRQAGGGGWRAEPAPTCAPPAGIARPGRHHRHRRRSARRPLTRGGAAAAPGPRRERRQRGAERFLWRGLR